MSAAGGSEKRMSAASL